jgi:phage portal protein BeeE
MDDVLYFTTPDGISIVNPSSRIDSLKFPLSNLKAQYNKRNVLLENIGAIGILSAKSNDIGGGIPMTPEEKAEIRNDWYRRSKDELIITEADVNWQPMSYPTKDLMLFEELNADKLALIDAFGLNSYIFSQDKGATFSNVKEGVRMAYTDTIIPETEQLYSSLTHQLGLDLEGLTLTADFSHLPILQQDENAKASAMNLRADVITKAQAAGINLSDDEIRLIIGI